MLRLKRTAPKPEDEYIALPGAEPLTIVKVANENLPYGCQCPLCGGIFQIPQGVLYKLEDDNIADIDSGAEFGASAESMTRSGAPQSTPEEDFQARVESRTEAPQAEEE